MLINYLNKIQDKKSLNTDEAYILQDIILSGKASDEEIFSLFQAFDARDSQDFKNSIKITKEEFNGFVRASQDKMNQIENNLKICDIVGTGGDDLKTFNISTAASLVCSSLDLKVAKHGNRAASGIFGSADILENLGYKIEQSSEEAKKNLETFGFVFLFAKSFNPAFRFAGPARKKFSQKTYFNFLGPLLNPTFPTYMLLGVSDWTMAKLMANNLIDSGVKKLWVVQSAEGMDEISAISETKIIEFQKNQKPKEFTIKPEDYNLVRGTIKDIQITSSEEAVEIFTQVIQGKAKPVQINSVAMNAAAILNISDKVKTYEEGLEIAKEHLASGKVWNFFKNLVVYFFLIYLTKILLA